MSSRLTLPPNAPFSGTQRMWLKGYLDGLSNSFGTTLNEPAPPPPSAGPPVTILWGSQTGNAEALGKRLLKQLSARGHAVDLLDMAKVGPALLARTTNFAVITSTYGDGEPPDNAAALHASLASPDAPSLAETSFAVFALGDSNYPDFCKCGHDFHSRLTSLGASALLEVCEADVDFDEAFSRWTARLFEKLSSSAPA